MPKAIIMKHLIPSIRINKQEAVCNTRAGLLLHPPFRADTIYRQLQFSYPKFFKMDPLCRWAFIGAELLCAHGDQAIYKGIAPEKIALVLATANGCMDVDHSFQESMDQVASPGLFVYTLPNIMLGELSIRHGFKGEQLCLVQEDFDAAEMQFAVQDLLLHRGMEACLCGWVNTANDEPELRLWWAERSSVGSLAFAD